MRQLGRFFKTAVERKRYTIDYSNWLDTGETLSTVTFTPDPVDGSLFNVDAHTIAADGLSVAFFVNYGTDGVTYTLDVLAVTSGGQTKEDQVVFIIKDL